MSFLELCEGLDIVIAVVVVGPSDLFKSIELAALVTLAPEAEPAAVDY